MNADQLLKHFDRISEAPDAVARLRRFVLDLAVRGKLVAQDPGDEPAGELLRRISDEKGRLVKRGAIRKSKRIPKVDPGSLAHGGPCGWEPTRLGEIIDLVSGQHLKPNEYSDASDRGLPYITGPADFGEAGLEISRYAIKRKAVAKQGQILLTVKGSGVGKATICDIPEVAISRQLMALTAIYWSQSYLSLVVEKLADRLKSSSRSLIPGISRDDVLCFQFFLPPLAEQHRIVAKVDELMAACDQLEQAQTTRENRRDRLVAATLHRLNNPDTEPESGPTFKQAAGFYLNHLPRLTTKPEHIQQLRQTILNLAVRGKLVPQDPGDEPAASEISRAFDSAGGKPPFRLPVNWLWSTPSGVTESIVDCPHSTPKWSDTGTVCVRTTELNPGFLDLSRTRFVDEDTYFERVKRLVPKVDDILYCREGNVGNACRIPEGVQLCMGQRMILLRAGPFISARFLELVLNSPPTATRVRQLITGLTAHRVNVRMIKDYWVPLPPLPEQHRIVAKVDEFMNLCATFDSQFNADTFSRKGLLEAMLHGAPC